MVVHAVDNETKYDVMFGMGLNKWGQLGKSSEVTQFIDKLTEIKVECLDNT